MLFPPLFHRGVGPKTAALIVSSLGADNVIDILNSEGAVAALAGVKGLGASKAAAIKADWDRSEGEGGLPYRTCVVCRRRRVRPEAAAASKADWDKSEGEGVKCE